MDGCSILSPNVSQVIPWWMAYKRLSIGAILAHSHNLHSSFSPTHRMEDKSPREGIPAWAGPQPGDSSRGRGLEDWRRRATPRSKYPDEEVDSKSRSRRKERSVVDSSSRSRRRDRYQNASGSEEESRPPDAKRREVLAALGKTKGVTSAGAWSARLEIANLLEIGCSPDHVISMVRKGKEADHPLGANGELKLVWVDDEGVVCGKGKRKASRSPLAEPSKLEDSSADESEFATPGSEKTGKIEAKAERSSFPPWAESPGTRDEVPQSVQGDVAPKVPSLSGFAKPARPPRGYVPGKPRDDEPKRTPLGEEAFQKKANPPREGTPVLGKIPVVSGKARGLPRSLADKEVQDLKKFQEFALLFFGFLRVEGVDMDLLELVTKPDGTVNEDRFALHTSPNKASTGLRYSRLMKGLLDWIKEDDRPRPKDDSVFNRLCLLEYVEWKIQEGCGAHTPKSILLAFDFFSKAFGYEAHGGHFGRAKRLSERAANNPVKGRVGAPLFSREFLIALEDLVLDPFLPHAQRVAAGKLRLCIQSSTRYDNIANTPLTEIVTLRVGETFRGA